MILASCNAIPKNIKQGGFLKGPAKVYDGAFNFDQTSSFIPQRAEDPFSILFAIDSEKNSSFDMLFSTRTALNNGMYFGFSTAYQFNIGRSGGGKLTVNFSMDNFTNGKNIIIVTYNGGLDATAVSIHTNRIAESISAVISNTLTPGVISTNVLRIGRGSNVSAFFNGAIKQFEVLNRVATAQEIADASNPITGGSFRAAGIAHNSGEYLFALNTDQTDGNPPTTFPDTPTYTITSFGGAQYVPYQSL